MYLGYVVNLTSKLNKNMKKRLFLSGCMVLGIIVFSVAQKDDLSIKMGSINLSVDPNVGGRISSFSINGNELLKTTRDQANLQWGSTLWPAPQQTWHWPPPKVIDALAYTVVKFTDSLILESRMDTIFGIRAKKIIAADPENNRFNITYEFTNKTDSAIQVGLWENTRIPMHGKVWYAKSGQKHFEWPAAVLDLTDTSLQDPFKYFIDTHQGWLVLETENSYYIKQFEVIDQSFIAPNQSLIEIYYDPENNLAELEVHGIYEILEPEESSSMTVYWYALDKRETTDLKKILKDRILTF